jgi:hypothetical protein
MNDLVALIYRKCLEWSTNVKKPQIFTNQYFSNSKKNFCYGTGVSQTYYFSSALGVGNERWTFGLCGNWINAGPEAPQVYLHVC